MKIVKWLSTPTPCIKPEDLYDPFDEIPRQWMDDPCQLQSYIAKNANFITYWRQRANECLAELKSNTLTPQLAEVPRQRRRDILKHLREQDNLQQRAKRMLRKILKNR